MRRYTPFIALRKRERERVKGGRVTRGKGLVAGYIIRRRRRGRGIHPGPGYRTVAELLELFLPVTRRFAFKQAGAYPPPREQRWRRRRRRWSVCRRLETKGGINLPGIELTARFYYIPVYRYPGHLCATPPPSALSLLPLSLFYNSPISLNIFARRRRDEGDEVATPYTFLFGCYSAPSPLPRNLKPSRWKPRRNARHYGGYRTDKVSVPPPRSPRAHTRGKMHGIKSADERRRGTRGGAMTIVVT